MVCSVRRMWVHVPARGCISPKCSPHADTDTSPFLSCRSPSLATSTRMPRQMLLFRTFLFLASLWRSVIADCVITVSSEEFSCESILPSVGEASYVFIRRPPGVVEFSNFGVLWTSDRHFRPLTSRVSHLFSTLSPLSPFRLVVATGATSSAGASTASAFRPSTRPSARATSWRPFAATSNGPVAKIVAPRTSRTGRSPPLRPGARKSPASPWPCCSWPRA
jgi:hypothetical protein